MNLLDLQHEEELRHQSQADVPATHEFLSLDESLDEVLPAATMGGVQLAPDGHGTDTDASDPLCGELDLGSQASVSKVVTALKLDALSGAKPELPLSCVKRVMEQAECAKPREIDEDAALCLESACQLLVRTITARSWAICTEDWRDTVQATDVIAAFEADDRFDFLFDTIERFKLNRNAKATVAA